MIKIDVLIAQVTLGALTIWTRKSVIPTTLHVAVGASILATSLTLTLRGFRRYALPAPQAAALPTRSRQEAHA